MASGGVAPIFYDYALFNSAYIDTGIKVSKNLAVELTFRHEAINKDELAFGFRSSTGSSQWVIYCYNSIYNYMGATKSNTMGEGYQKYVVFVDVLNKKWKLTHDSTIDIDESFSPTNPSTTAKAGNVWWGKTNGSYSPISVTNTAKQYGCKIWESGTLKRDYRPCKYDGVAGMWEMVSNSFVPMTAGTITLGND